MKNVWDEAGILPMAIRLRKSGKCPADIDNLYGEIMGGIVRMAAALLPSEDPRYECWRSDFMCEDVQAEMLCKVLVVAEKYVDTDRKPRDIVNYLVKAVQNRLRNYVRDTENRRSKVPVMTESELGFAIEELGCTVRMLDGRMAQAEVRGRVITTEIN